MYQDYNLYCFRLPAGCNSMYAMSISVPNYAGTSNVYYYDDVTSLQRSFTVMGLTADQQNQILNPLTSDQKMMVMSLVSIADGVAKNFGIELHDGDMPMENNQIQFSKVAEPGQELTVNIMVNDQIMPAPVQGVYRWAKVHDCLLQSGYFTDAQIQALKQQVEQAGLASANWQGISTKIVAGLG
jgi:hypothetical protein